MLKKIVSIRNVGKFRSCTAKGDVELRRATLFYAENGRGKTTLCDIMRSLHCGDASLVLGRTTLGTTDPPYVEMLVDSKKAVLANGMWSATQSDIAVYDAKFVHANVHAGEHIDHSQRRGLYSVIVGETGVALARAVDDLDRKIREANGAISETEARVRPLVPAGMSLETFALLAKDDDVDEHLRAAELSVALLNQASEIANTAKLMEIELPAYPGNTIELLGKTIGKVSAEVEELLTEHARRHMREMDEAWLARGADLIAGDHCPFCSQNTKGIAVVDAIATKFSAAYRQLASDVARLIEAADAFASEVQLLRLEQITANNERLSLFWGRFLAFEPPALEFVKVRSQLQLLRDEIRKYAGAKAASPLEGITPGGELEKAIAGYAEASQAVVAYANAVESANGLIEAKKADAKAGDLGAEQRNLRDLKAKQVRHSPEGTKACKDLEEAKSLKTNLTNEKETAKQALDRYATEVFGRYEKRINDLLDEFGAGFRLARARSQYIGGRPSSTYQLMINGCEVELGDAETTAGVPSFKNTLSSGDKSTLALAFFLAQLQENSRIAEVIVVFDDPFTSQDRSRRACTQRHIRKIARDARQTIVLSHDGKFLKDVWSELDPATVKTLQLTRMGDNTTITEWDVQNELQGEYFENHAVLRRYRDDGEGDPRSVARAIRPLLEGYLKFKLPGQFEGKGWLGEFIAAIRGAKDDEPMVDAKCILDELEALNDYSKRYHHAQNPSGADTDPVDQTELETHARRALKLVGGF